MLTPYLIKKIIKQIFLFIHYLIKNKGNITLLMLKEDFEKSYNIKEDNEGYIIHTNIICLMYDIKEDN